MTDPAWILHRKLYLFCGSALFFAEKFCDEWMSCISLLQIFEFVLVFRAPYHFEVGCTLFFPLLPTSNSRIIRFKLWYQKRRTQPCCASCSRQAVDDSLLLSQERVFGIDAMSIVQAVLQLEGVFHSEGRGTGATVHA